MDGVKELYLYDDIGAGGIEAKSVKRMLGVLEGDSKVNEVLIRIISMGGSVLEADKITEVVKSFKEKTGKKVTFINDIFAASAAVNIMADAGDEFLGNEGTHTLVHRSWTNSKITDKTVELAKEALKKGTGTTIEVLSKKTGLSTEEIEDLLDQERWLTLDESMGYGIIDGVNGRGSINVDLAKKYLTKIGLATEGVVNGDLATVYGESYGEVKAQAQSILKETLDNLEEKELINRAETLMASIQARWEI